MMNCTTSHLSFERVTPAGNHHYFGYYDKSPWDVSGRYLLSMMPTFIDRQPSPDDELQIGMTDLHSDGEWTPLAVTHAWNWQQGTMLHWLPSANQDATVQEIIYNVCVGDGDTARFASECRNPFTGEAQQFPRPIYCLRPDGGEALSVNFARIARTRPGYGYEGVVDAGVDDRAPEDDGIWVMDLETGENRLIISLRDMSELHPKPGFDQGVHWFNHLQYSPDGTRFLFLHRWGLGDGIRWGTRLLTAKPDGSDIRIIADDGMTSHFDWCDSGHILAWASVAGRGDHFYVFDALTGEAEIVAPDLLTVDGHCSYDPPREWILTDTYPDETDHRTLLLLNINDGNRIDIGRFYSPPEITGPYRCDLHPRWSRDGTQVCVDSVHEGTRGMYVADVRELVGDRSA
jgi:hypothetical protein